MRDARARIDAWVEAVIELRAYDRAIREEGDTPRRQAARTDARARLRRAEGALSGSLLGAARRALAERNLNP